MRGNIVYQGADELTYEIREIVEFGKRLEKEGLSLIWENIGDPVAKGEAIPTWVKGHIKDALEDDATFAYSPTKGLLETRIFLSELRAKEGNGTLDPENILFFNGLGDAIAKVYTYLNKSARVIGPSPSYSTHSSAEAAHAGAPHITYTLEPHNGWLPNIEELRKKIQENEHINGILVINPDNPTGMMYPESALREIVQIAKEFDLFLICDEIYSNIHYGTEPFVPLSRILDGVPAIIMKGLSKEIPWPGARCGWIEVYNVEKDPVFARYVKTINDAKMLEVCATTLPQKVLPKIFADPRYGAYLQSRRDVYSARADVAYKELSAIPNITVVKPSGAFYVTVVFNKGALLPGQTLPIESDGIRALVEAKVRTLREDQLDKRFAYYLMGAKGVCIVPLSGFNTELFGFRMTLLEENKEIFEKTLRILQEGIAAYTNSGAFVTAPVRNQQFGPLGL